MGCSKINVEDAYLRIVPFAVSIVSLQQKVVACVAIIMFIGSYGFKFLLNRGTIPMWLQIISHPLIIKCDFRLSAG